MQYLVFRLYEIWENWLKNKMCISLYCCLWYFLLDNKKESNTKATSFILNLLLINKIYTKQKDEIFNDIKIDEIYIYLA